MPIEVHDTVSGESVTVEDAPVGAEVVERSVAALGLPTRSESGEPLTYELFADGTPIGADDPRQAGRLELRSPNAADVYVKAKATLDEIHDELAADDDSPKFHLTTRLAFIRRTGAFPRRVAEIEKELSERVFSFAPPMPAERSRRTRLYVVAGFAVFVAVFGWLFWVTRPSDPVRDVDRNAIDERDFGDDQAVLDPADLPIQLSGEIAVRGEIDSYLLELPEGVSVRISLRAFGGNFEGAFDTELSVNGPAGDQVAYNDDIGGTLNSGVSFVTPTAGTYDIRAGALGGGSTGAYELTIEVDS